MQIQMIITENELQLTRNYMANFNIISAFYLSQPGHTPTLFSTNWATAEQDSTEQNDWFTIGAKL